MSVYVHNCDLPCIPNRRWRWKTVSHMIADTDEELVALAVSIGLKRSWLQRGSRGASTYTRNHN